MDNLTSIANLLGEDNEKRLKDGITDLLLEQVEKDLHDRYEYEFIIAFDDIYEEVKEQIKEEFTKELAKKYKEIMNEKMKKIFEE